jgi:hypothetical protein
MAAGVTDRLWETVDVVHVLDAFEDQKRSRRLAAHTQGA